MSSSSISNNDDGEDDTMINAELEAWREAHNRLMEAVIVAKEAVSAAKAQRRYWLEEICSNLTPEGKLVAQTSVWKRETPHKTKPLKRKSTVTAAGKKSGSGPKRRKLVLPTAASSSPTIPIVAASALEDDEDEETASPLHKIVQVSAATNTTTRQPAKLKYPTTGKQFRPVQNDDDDDDDEDNDDDDDDTQSEDEDHVAVAARSSTESSSWAAAIPTNAALMAPSPAVAASATANMGFGAADMSHIPEELRPFMMAQQQPLGGQQEQPPPPPAAAGPYGNPYASFAAHGISEDSSDGDAY